jgi:hypothetical protein
LFAEINAMGCNCKKSPSAPKSNAVTKITKNTVPQSVVSKKKSVSSKFTASPAIMNMNVPGETMADKCRTFAYMLGRKDPVSEAVLVAAIENSSYGRRLLANRYNEQELQNLLNNPPGYPPATRFGTGMLITKASKALMKWAVSGFSTVAPDTLEKRETACLECPNLTAATNSLQQYSAPSAVGTHPGTRTGNSVCALCGCVVRNKIRLATETCPDPCPDDSTVNRWGEPLQ